METIPLKNAVSGGSSSMFMARQNQHKYAGSGRRLFFLFCNTGQEDPRTLDFVHECDTRWGLGIIWLEAVVQADMGAGTRHRVVDYCTAQRPHYAASAAAFPRDWQRYAGLMATRPADWPHPFEAVMQKFGLPNQVFQSCSRELKERAMNSYMREQLAGAPYESAIGIRADETFRINWVRAKLERLVYPLATDWPVSKIDVRKWWARQPFRLELKDYEGNCDVCWKKSKRKKGTLLRERPFLADWWQEMEGRHELLLKPNEISAAESAGRALQPRAMHRNHETMFDLVEYAQSGEFKQVRDEYERYLHTHGFDLYDEVMDAETACSCS